jgi:hypothetical protein
MTKDEKGEPKFLLFTGWTASVFAAVCMAIALAGALWAVAAGLRRLF